MKSAGSLMKYMRPSREFAGSAMALTNTELIPDSPERTAESNVAMPAISGVSSDMGTLAEVSDDRLSVDSATDFEEGSDVDTVKDVGISLRRCRMTSGFCW